jgi:hypothetical protein
MGSLSRFELTRSKKNRVDENKYMIKEKMQCRKGELKSYQLFSSGSLYRT